MAEGLTNSLNKNSTNRTVSNKIESSTTDLKKEQTNKSFRSSKSIKSNSQIPTTPTKGATATSNSKRTVLKSIRNLFVKASVNLSIAAAKLKSFAEDALSSDEIVNELFLVTSSSSVDSSLLEQQEEAATVANNHTVTGEAGAVTGAAAEVETDSRAGTSDMTVNSSDETNSSENGLNTVHSLPRFQDFDAVQEAKKLQREQGNNVVFSDGHQIWQKRREIWQNSTSEERTKAKQKSLENSLIGVSKDNYPIIYNSLIEKQKTLKKPMNLKDALKIINAGWIASKKWERAAQGLA